MKSKNIIILFLLMSFLTTGCEYKYGSITRSIRHSGFNVASSKFKCELVDHAKYYTGTYMIDDNGKLYDVSLSKIYQNGMNCKKSEFENTVLSIFDGSIIKANDGKYYYLNDSGTNSKFKEVTIEDQKYGLYDLFFSNNSLTKIMTVNSNEGIYYALSSDGNVYEYVVDKNNVVTSSEIKYKKDEYGKIEDFNYMGKNSTTYVNSENGIYKMSITNIEACGKYADVDCVYEFNKSEGLSTYKDSILAYSGSTVITKYGRVFTSVN